MFCAWLIFQLGVHFLRDTCTPATCTQGQSPGSKMQSGQQANVVNEDTKLSAPRLAPSVGTGVCSRLKRKPLRFAFLRGNQQGNRGAILGLPYKDEQPMFKELAKVIAGRPPYGLPGGKRPLFCGGLFLKGNPSERSEQKGRHLPFMVQKGDVLNPQHGKYRDLEKTASTPLLSLCCEPGSFKTKRKSKDRPSLRRLFKEMLHIISGSDFLNPRL